MSQPLTPEMQAILDAARRGIAQAEANLARLRGIEAMVLGGSQPAPPTKAASPIAAVNGKTMTIGEAAEAVLRQAGKPLGTSEIGRRILDGGLYQSTVGFKDFVNNVFSTLKRKDDLFRKVAPGTWGLAVWGTGGDQ